MPVLFMGGEPADFTIYGNTSWVTAYGRRAFSRGAITVDRFSSTLPPFSNEIVATFSQPSLDFWTSFYMDGVVAGYAARRIPAIGWRDMSGKVRFGLGNDDFYRILAFVGSDQYNMSVAHTNDHPNTWQGGHRYDIHIKVVGLTLSAKVFCDSVKVLDWSGPTEPIDGFASMSLSNNAGGAGGWYYYSEVTATTFDSRSLILYTHPPVSNGPIQEWDGGYQNIDEADWINSADVIKTDTAPKTSSFGIKPLPTGDHTIRAFKVQGVFSRGSEAIPTAIRLGVGSSGSLGFSEAHEIETGTTWISNTWEANPATGLTWTPDDINSMYVAVRSEGFPEGTLPTIHDGSTEAGAWADSEVTAEVIVGTAPPVHEGSSMDGALTDSEITAEVITP